MRDSVGPGTGPEAGAAPGSAPGEALVLVDRVRLVIGPGAAPAALVVLTLLTLLVDLVDTGTNAGPGTVTVPGTAPGAILQRSPSP